MDAAFLKWAWDAYGYQGLAVAIMVGLAWKNKEQKPDIAKELMSKIEGIDAKVQMMGERVARIEGKLDND